MSIPHVNIIDDWTVEFHKNIHMYSHSLKLSNVSETYDVLCEDSPYGFIGIWPYELKGKVSDATYHELITVLRKWAIQSSFQYRLYTSPKDYETTDTIQ